MKDLDDSDVMVTTMALNPPSTAYEDDPSNQDESDTIESDADDDENDEDPEILPPSRPIGMQDVIKIEDDDRKAIDSGTDVEEVDEEEAVQGKGGIAKVPVRYSDIPYDFSSYWCAICRSVCFLTLDLHLH